MASALQISKITYLTPTPESQQVLNSTKTAGEQKRSTFTANETTRGNKPLPKQF